MNTPPAIPHAPRDPPAPQPAGNPWAGLAIDVLIAIGVMIGTTILGMVGWGVFKAIEVGIRNPGAAADPQAMTQAIGDPSGMLLMGVSSLGMLIAALAVYYFRRRATPEERQRSKTAAARPRTWLEAIGLGLGLFVVGSGLMWGLQRMGHQPNPTNLKMLEALMAYSPAMLVVFAVVMAPVTEELLFRRGFFGRLWAANQPMAGIIASSTLFAFAHEVPGTTDSPFAMTLVLLFFYAGMGASFAWIYRRTGTLWAPIAAHATNNLLGVGLMLAGYAG